jgi:hypothetical protein
MRLQRQSGRCLCLPVLLLLMRAGQSIDVLPRPVTVLLPRLFCCTPTKRGCPVYVHTLLPRLGGLPQSWMLYEHRRHYRQGKCRGINDGSDSDDDGLPSNGCHRHGTLSRATAMA